MKESFKFTCKRCGQTLEGEPSFFKNEAGQFEIDLSDMFCECAEKDDSITEAIVEVFRS